MFISSHVFGYIPSQSIWQKATDPKDHFTCWSAVEYLGKKEKVKVQELFDCNITVHIFQECKDSLQDFILPVESEVMQDIYAVGTQENNYIK